jgi:hypothetical protein
VNANPVTAKLIRSRKLRLVLSALMNFSLFSISRTSRFGDSVFGIISLVKITSKNNTKCDYLNSILGQPR